METVVQLLSFVVLIGIGQGQKNLASNGTASQSSTWVNNGISYDAILAITGEPTHDSESESCSYTDTKQKVAWWMLTFPFETVFTSNVIIYYRSISQWRFAGFSLYITNNSILENATGPPIDGLCYHHNGTDLPNILQNITCDQTGKHVIIYNERKDGVQYPNNDQYAFLELCDVQIIGCYKSWWGERCRLPCPAYCVDSHCHPGNGTCVWGCSSINCLDSECNNDGMCTKGCKKGRGGLLCNENNVAEGIALVSSDTPNQNAFLVIDGDKRETSCVTLSGKDSWVRVDTRDVHAIKSLNIIFKEEFSVSDYFVFVTNTSDIRPEAINTTDGSLVMYTFPFPVHEHRLNPLIVGRYVLVSKMFTSLPMGICELEIVGCPVGRYGDRCEKICPINCDGTCHLENGICVFGCQSGFLGDVCDKTCPSSMFGRQCTSTCHCMHQPCDHVNGTCPPGGCREGWKGYSCSEECGRATFGKNCKQTCNGCLNAECNSTTGECKDVSGCRPGWKNGNPMCNIECDNGYFGDCFSKCHCRDGYCEKSTGMCPGHQCDRGWMGDTCSEECNQGTFGFNCLAACNSCVNNTCDAYDGNCSYGCRDGYVGYRCWLLEPNRVERRDQKSRDSTLFVVIGGALGFSMIVVVAVVGAVFLNRRRSFDSNKSDANELDSTNMAEDRNGATGIYEETRSSTEDRHEYDSLASVATNRTHASYTEYTKKESVYVNHDSGNHVVYCNMPSTKYPANKRPTMAKKK